MAKVQLIAEVEPELERLVTVAAESNDQSVSEWVEESVRRSLGQEDDNVPSPPQSPEPGDTEEPIRLRSGGTLDLKDRQLLARKYPDMHFPPPGVKPKGSKNPIRLRGGGLMSDAVLEDRGER